MSSVRPIAVRGCRAIMSLRSGKQSAAVGLAQVTGMPSMTSWEKPLTRAMVPGGMVVTTLPGFQPVDTPAGQLFFTHLECWNCTPSCNNAIQPCFL